MKTKEDVKNCFWLNHDGNHDFYNEPSQAPLKTWTTHINYIDENIMEEKREEQFEKEDIDVMLVEREDIDVIRAALETICQMATDRKTGNGFEMQPMDALDEIRVKAKDTLEYLDVFIGTKFKIDRVDLSTIKPETGVPLRND